MSITKSKFFYYVSKNKFLKYNYYSSFYSSNKDIFRDEHLLSSYIQMFLKLRRWKMDVYILRELEIIDSKQQ